MKMQHKLSALAILPMMAMGPVQAATFTGASSNTSYVQVGASDVNAGPHVSGKAGISVPGSPLGTEVDFGGLALFAGTGAVKVLSYPYDPESPHPNLGVFAFSNVEGDVWFGEWSTNGSPSYSNRTVYYIGDSTNASLPSGTVTGVQYNVAGINQYNGSNALSGTFTANFVGGIATVSGAITDPGSRDLRIAVSASNVPHGSGSVQFSGTATATNEANTATYASGSSQGAFFGVAASSLAGIATFSGAGQYDTAFGGIKN